MCNKEEEEERREAKRERRREKRVKSPSPTPFFFIVSKSSPHSRFRPSNLSVSLRRQSFSRRTSVKQGRREWDGTRLRTSFLSRQLSTLLFFFIRSIFASASFQGLRCTRGEVKSERKEETKRRGRDALSPRLLRTFATETGKSRGRKVVLVLVSSVQRQSITMGAYKYVAELYKKK